MVLRFLRRRPRDGDKVMPDLDDGSMEGESGVDLLNSLKHFEKMHRLDPNLPLEELDEVEIALNTSNAEKGAEIEQILNEDNSPYPEVRSHLGRHTGSWEHAY